MSCVILDNDEQRKDKSEAARLHRNFDAEKGHSVKIKSADSVEDRSIFAMILEATRPEYAALVIDSEERDPGPDRITDAGSVKSEYATLVIDSEEHDSRSDHDFHAVYTKSEYAAYVIDGAEHDSRSDRCTNAGSTKSEYAANVTDGTEHDSRLDRNSYAIDVSFVEDMNCDITCDVDNPGVYYISNRDCVAFEPSAVVVDEAGLYEMDEHRLCDHLDSEAFEMDEFGFCSARESVCAMNTTMDHTSVEVVEQRTRHPTATMHDDAEGIADRRWPRKVAAAGKIIDTLDSRTAKSSHLMPPSVRREKSDTLRRAIRFGLQTQKPKRKGGVPSSNHIYMLDPLGGVCSRVATLEDFRSELFFKVTTIDEASKTENDNHVGSATNRRNKKSKTINRVLKRIRRTNLRWFTSLTKPDAEDAASLTTEETTAKYVNTSPMGTIEEKSITSTESPENRRRRKRIAIVGKRNKPAYVAPEWQRTIRLPTIMPVERKSKFVQANILNKTLSRYPRVGVPTSKDAMNLQDTVKTLGLKGRAKAINNVKKHLFGEPVIDSPLHIPRVRPRRIIIDSASEGTFVRSSNILDWPTKRDAKADGVAVRGYTSKIAQPVHTAVRLLPPFGEIEAYYSPDFGDDILAWNTLEELHEVQIVRDEDNHYLRCVNYMTGDIIRCFKDKDTKNFYTYQWPESADITCFKVSTNLEKAQKMGLSKAGAVRAIEAEALHKSLGHASFEIMRRTLKQQVFHDLALTPDDVDNCENFIGCIGCELGKIHREPAVVTDPPTPTNAIGDLVHADMFSISSADKTFKTLNFLAVIDDYCGYLNIFPLASGSAADIINGIKLVAAIYEKANHKIKKIRSDNGGGFIAEETKKTLANMNVSIVSIENDEEIKSELTAMRIDLEHCTAQSHVRVVERAIRHAKDLFRSTLFDLPFLLPNELYKHLMVYVASSINLTINVNNEYVCPWQLMHGKAPRAHDFLRSSFGQLVTTYNQFNPNKRSDDTVRADVGIVIGRDSSKPGSFWVYDVHDKAIVSRHDLTSIGWTQQLLNNFKQTNNQAHTGASVRFIYGDQSTSEIIDLKKKREQIENDSKLKVVERDIIAPTDLSSLATSIVPQESAEESTYRADISNLLSAYNMSISKSTKAVGEEATEKAALAEIDALIRLKVFKFLNPNQWAQLLRDGVNIITSQMILKQKFDSNNEFEKNKARLVGHGHKQIFDEVFSARAESPTINISIVFAGLAIAAKSNDPNLDIQVVDVDNAYLHADLVQPEWMYIGKDVAAIICKHHVQYIPYLLPDGRLLVELQKALYGLRTAGRDWYNLINSTLQSSGYKRSEWDKCLYVHEDSTQVYLYVDDLLIIGKRESIEKLKKVLIVCFKSIKTKTGLSLSYLGMSIEKKHNGDIHVHQRGYIENMAKEYKCETPSTYPSNANLLHRDKDIEDDTPISTTEYLSLAMKIMFVVVRCRPDALFATTVLAARCQKPTITDYGRLLKIVQYLYGSKDQALIFRHDRPIKLRMFVDASFQTHRDAKGHSGFILFLDDGSAGVLFKSKKQQCVTNSSAEAELVSLHEGVQQLTWMAQILEELGVKDQYPIDVFEDSKSAIQMSTSETVNFRGRSKFIDRKYFSIYQHVEDGKINLVYVGTESMIADFFTKAMVGKKFTSFKFSIMGGLE